MDPESAARSHAFVQKFLDMHPKPFKSFFSRFINERIVDTGLTESQIIFLTILDEEEGMSLKDMTEMVGVHKSLTTRAVKHLSDMGFVINIAEKGKEHAVVLTEKGTKAKETAVRALGELFALLLEDLSDEELATMEQVMTKIRQKMDELSSKDMIS